MANLNDLPIAGYLRDYMCTSAPAGYEKEMAYKLRDHFRHFCPQVHIDRLGNVVATFAGSQPAAPSTMVFGHMDQVGFVVRRIDEDGFLRLERVGGIPEKALPGLRLHLLAKNGAWVPGAIAMKAHHATPPEEKYKVEELASLFVDIGAKSRQEALDAGLEIGAPAVYAPAFEQLLNGRVSGTSVDNRGACAVLADVARQLAEAPPRGTVHLVGTVWEEFNLRGACVAARRLKPDIALCLDVIIGGDTPDLKARYDNALGAGPAISLYSFHGRGTLNGVIPHQGLVRHAEQTARSQQIHLQRFASAGLLTDNSYVQLENEGIACLDMAFPARYTHTPVEVCDLGDLAQLANLVCGMVQTLPADFELARY